MNFNEALELMKQGKKVKINNAFESDTVYWLKNDKIYKKSDICEGDAGGISTYQILADDWEEYKEPLLTEEEKEYLKIIIKFGDYHIRTIEKNKLCPSMHNRSYLIFNKCWGDANEPYDASSLFDVNKYFTGLEFGKEYTLKELGLED